MAGETLEKAQKTRETMQKLISEAQYVLKQWDEAQERGREEGRKAMEALENEYKLDYE